MPDISAKIKNLEINPALMNGSGVLSFTPILMKYAELKLGAVVTKSVSSEVREGFENPIYTQVSEEAFINAVGLPGAGHKEKRKELGECYDFFKKKKKPLIASIFDGDEKKLTEVAMHMEDVCDAFEINLSCPNLMPGDQFGILVGRDPSLVEMYTKAVTENVKKPVFPKLSPGPYIDDSERFKKIVLACANSNASAITAINTISGGMKIDIHAKRPILAAKFGGVSGKAIKPIGMGAVYTAYDVLKENGYDIPIIAVGGIKEAGDIIEYALAGASAFQIATYFSDKSLKEADIYLNELCKNIENILKDLGARSLEEIRGSAHE
jgi:dihydroorotate dehydrogenase (NAD+) catalytic subunit